MGVPIHQEILRLDVSVTNPDGSNHIPTVRNHGVQLLDNMLNIKVTHSPQLSLDVRA